MRPLFGIWFPFLGDISTPCQSPFVRKKSKLCFTPGECEGGRSQFRARAAPVPSTSRDGAQRQECLAGGATLGGGGREAQVPLETGLRPKIKIKQWIPKDS